MRAEHAGKVLCAQRSLGKVDGKILLRSDPSVKKAPKNQAVSQVILHGIAGSLRASVHSPGESSECTQATLYVNREQCPFSLVWSCSECRGHTSAALATRSVEGKVGYIVGRAQCLPQSWWRCGISVIGTKDSLSEVSHIDFSTRNVACENSRLTSGDFQMPRETSESRSMWGGRGVTAVTFLNRDAEDRPPPPKKKNNNNNNNETVEHYVFYTKFFQWKLVIQYYITNVYFIKMSK